jgi:hypothetical protein
MINFEQLPDSSRVWIYQSNRAFTSEESNTIQNALNHFVKEWRSHGKEVVANGTLRYNRFVIFTVDESYEAPSGCSIDSSVAFIKELEQQYKVDMFDRFNFAYKSDDTTVESADRITFAELYAEQKINATTTVFNNLVNTKADLQDNWETTIEASWHKNMV